MKGILKVLFPVWALTLLAGASAAEPTVRWSGEPTQLTAAPGETVSLKVSAEIPLGWHMYSLRKYKLGPQHTSFTLKPGVLALAGSVGADRRPRVKYDDGFNINVETYDGSVVFTVPLQIQPGTAPGEYAATLVASSQLCGPTMCLNPRDQELTIKITVSQNTQMAAAPSQITPGGEGDQLARAKGNGLAAYLWLSLVAGATALLTPCVFPMIPITVSFFLKRRQTTRRRAIRDAGVYSLGIIFMFTGIGFLFALLLGATGITDFAANPWVNLAIAGVFVILALNLFGVYEIQLPSGLINRLNRKADQGQGLGSVLLMGLVFSLTSFTCTVPFVGALMVSATRGEWLWPLLGMLVFSSVFAAPFFFLALFPAALRSLPRAGGWLNSVKVLMGILEVAAALKFLSNADLVWRWHLLTREVFLFVWIALAIVATLYCLGHIRFVHDRRVERVGRLRLISATGFVSVALFLTGGLLGRPLGLLDSFAPPHDYPQAASSSDEQGWLADWNTALAEAKRLKKPLFVDFTGYTCTNCRRMETGMFPRPGIAAELQDYVRVRLYTDGRKDAAEAERSRRNQQLQQERYQTTALPFYAIVAPDGTDKATFPGYTEDVRTFQRFLQSGG